MRCHEARNRINVGDLDDTSLTEHLRKCPACASLAAAESRLSNSLRVVSEDRTQLATPMPILRQRIEQMAAPSLRKETALMSTLLNQIRAHRRLSVSLAAAVAVFLFVMLVPISYQRVTGYDASVAFADLPREIPKESLRSALATIGQSDAKVMLEKQNEKTIYRVKGLSSQLAARELVAVLNALAGTKGRPEITPVLETVSASLFAQARDKIITIEVDGAGKTDAELETEISAKLTEAGLSPDQVTVTTGSDGYRQISISASRNNAEVGDSAQIQLKVKGDSKVGFNMLSPEETKNMTDAELKAALEAKLAEQGITNADVVVTKDAEGKRKVEVKAQK
jgi:hypothetical protein